MVIKHELCICGHGMEDHQEYHCDSTTGKITHDTTQPPKRGKCLFCECVNPTFDSKEFLKYIEREISRRATQIQDYMRYANEVMVRNQPSMNKKED